MGLIKRKDFRKFETRLIVLEMLKEYGIEPEDLHYLHDALIKVKEMKENNIQVENGIDESVKKENKKNASGKTTPSDFINQFTAETEEFYPYGKPKTDNN